MGPLWNHFIMQRINEILNGVNQERPFWNLMLKSTNDYKWLPFENGVFGHRNLELLEQVASILTTLLGLTRHWDNFLPTHLTERVEVVSV